MPNLIIASSALTNRSPVQGSEGSRGCRPGGPCHGKRQRGQALQRLLWWAQVKCLQCSSWLICLICKQAEEAARALEAAEAAGLEVPITAEAEGPSLHSHSLGGEACSDEEWEDVDAEVCTTRFELAYCLKQSMAVCCGNGTLPNHTAWVERRAATRLLMERYLRFIQSPGPLICACMRLH